MFAGSLFFYGEKLDAPVGSGVYSYSWGRSSSCDVITTGDVDRGGAATQPDPWAVGGTLKVGDSGTGTLNVDAGGGARRIGAISVFFSWKQIQRFDKHLDSCTTKSGGVILERFSCTDWTGPLYIIQGLSD